MMARGNDIRPNENACEAVKKWTVNLQPCAIDFASVEAAAMDHAVITVDAGVRVHLEHRSTPQPKSSLSIAEVSKIRKSKEKKAGSGSKGTIPIVLSSFIRPSRWWAIDLVSCPQAAPDRSTGDGGTNERLLVMPFACGSIVIGISSNFFSARGASARPPAQRHYISAAADTEADSNVALVSSSSFPSVPPESWATASPEISMYPISRSAWRRSELDLPVEDANAFVLFLMMLDVDKATMIRRRCELPVRDFRHMNPLFINSLTILGERHHRQPSHRHANLLGSHVVRPADIVTIALGTSYADGLAAGIWIKEQFQKVYGKGMPKSRISKDEKAIAADNALTMQWGSHTPGFGDAKMLCDHEGRNANAHIGYQRDFAQREGTLGAVVAEESPKAHGDDEALDDLPESVDWEASGAVNSPQHQVWFCGSCWAHAAVGSIEGIHKIRFNVLPRLSVQEIIDCAIRTKKITDEFGRTYNIKVKGKGCYGGFPSYVYDYVKKWGIVSEDSYRLRWIRSHGKCRRDEKMDIAGFISGFVFNPPNEKSLMKAVSKQPVVVLLDKPPPKITNGYNGWIIDMDEWPPSEEHISKRIRHAVLLVGYGKDSEGKLFWKIKNSWGLNWGRRGFGYLRRGVADERGVGGITQYANQTLEIEWGGGDGGGEG
uniref:Peptidase C1A papain C-terminal domain-containing protein n=1 Tax=Oryza meridionalis TaxID=40149 RepID=A0A0E0EE88_9ORYZ